MGKRNDPMIGILMKGGVEVPYVMESSGPDGQYRPREFNSMAEANRYCAKARAHAKQMREAAAALGEEFGL